MDGVGWLDNSGVHPRPKTIHLNGVNGQFLSVFLQWCVSVTAVTCVCDHSDVCVTTMFCVLVQR